MTGGAATAFSAVRLNAGQNLAEGRPATVSSSHTADGWSPYGAVDGERDSTAGSMGWSSVGTGDPAHPESITVDLGTAQPVSRVDLFARNDGANTGLGFPVDFTVAVSVDGAQWTEVVRRTGYPQPDPSAQSFPSAATTARYVRVTGTRLTADQFGTHYLQLAQVEVR